MVTRTRPRQQRTAKAPSGSRPPGSGTKRGSTKKGPRSQASRNKQTRSRANEQGRKRRIRLWSALRGLLVVAIWALVAMLGVVAWFAYDLPDVDEVAGLTRRPSVTVEAADGTMLASFGALYGPAVPVDDLPAYLPAAVMAVEDRRFYDHWGIDPLGILRAAFVNLRAGHVVQGGSTITQQVAKNLFLTHERSYKRKIQEVLLALWLEARFTKDQILTLYLNRVYLGAGTYGVEAAAQRYFDRSAREVTLYQAAMLAGLLKAPSRYNPVADPEAARRRTAVVLRAMADAGVLTSAQAEEVAAAGGKAVAGVRRGGVGRHFADWIMERVDEYVGRTDQDVVVHTTLDYRLQAAAERAVAEMLRTEGPSKGVTEAAVVVLDPEGAVRAMVGGRDYGRSQFNRAVQAHRQPGSAFKPFVYLAALEAGMEPDDTVTDAPVRVEGWSPTNFDGTFRGAVTLREAAARSLNTVAVSLQERVGRDAVMAVAERLGVPAGMQPTPSLALGTEEVALLPLTAAYAPFANGGKGVLPHGIVTITGRDGRVLYSRTGEGLGQVVKPGDVAAMNDLLGAVIAWGTGKAAALDRPAAGKTGTSQDHRDAWFIGYTADFVAGVWMGNDDDRPTKGVTGGGMPARLWTRVMQEAHEGLPPRPLPSVRGESGLTRFLRNLFGGRDGRPPVQRESPNGGFPVDWGKPGNN